MLAASGPAAGSGFVGSYMDMGVSEKLGGGGEGTSYWENFNNDLFSALH